jgi:hypothetical protein
MIVPVAHEAHHRAHLDPILAHLPHAEARCNRSDVALVASYGGLRRARRQGFQRIVLAQHGAGQSYGGDRRRSAHPSYPGGSDNADVGLFLVPNEHAAGRWRRAYPRTPVAVVGCPKLDTLPKRSGTGGPVVAVSFHFDLSLLAETRSARMHFTSALPGLARSYRLIGHSHPRLDLSQFYRRMGIEYVRDFDEVCRRADVYVCDNSSTLFEFAATGRPVVVLNEPHYRRDVEHGLRFWDAADVGIQVDSPHDLAPAIRLALDDGPEQRARREAALSLVYAYRTGGAKRAAEAIMGWAAEVAA